MTRNTFSGEGKLRMKVLNTLAVKYITVSTECFLGLVMMFKGNTIIKPS